MQRPRRLPSFFTGVILAAGLLCGFCCPAALAEPVANVQHTYYPVDGLTASQIRDALDRNTPVRKNGKTFDAYTRWNVAWQFYWTPDNSGTCRITSVSTTVRIHYTLPRLQANADRPLGLESRWKQFIAALVAHEKGHAALGVKAAREIERRLAQIEERDSCHQLEADANRLAEEIIAQYARIEDQYDADTDHGAGDGARFP